MLGIPRHITVMTEASIAMLVFCALMSPSSCRRHLPHLWYILLVFICIMASSIVFNGSSTIRAIFSLRLLYRFYFFYLGITLFDFDDKNIKRINMFICLLFLLQVPIIVYKFSLYGIAEDTQGAYNRDGSLTTMLPIVGIFYLGAYYFYYRPKLRYIYSGIGFILFSIVGDKRAVFFLYGPQFLAIYYWMYIKGKGVAWSSRVLSLYAAVTFIVIVSSSVLFFNKSLNPEGKVGGSLDPSYAVQYAKEYTTGDYKTGTRGYGTSGRYSTTKRIIEKLWDSGPVKLFFGFGPGSATPSLFDSAEEKMNRLKFFEMLRVAYGLTTMTMIALEYGILGVIAFGLIIFLFARMCLRYYQYEVDPYWKAFAAGSVGFAFSMLFFFLAYHWTAFWGDTLPALYFYAMAVVYTRLQRVRTAEITYNDAHAGVYSVI